jgi:glycosyltransferase involved in cell wall biosynthesis
VSKVNEPMKISVIIPVYNGEQFIARAIDSVLAQTRPADEIIVVDNGSGDMTKQIVRKYPVTLLEENRIQSSYAARNKAIQAASGDIIAFIDADCIASQQWLREGVAMLSQDGVDIVGGKVEFTYSEKKTAAEYYDTMRHFNFQETIARRLGTGTGNLFVRKACFDRLGLFPKIPSGGDFIWTKKAIESGFDVCYSEKSIVYHPARKFIEIIQKHFRTGSGYLHKRLSLGIGKVHEFFYFPYCLLFTWPPFKEIQKEIAEDGRAELTKKYMGIVFVAYLSKVAYYLGAWYELLCILVRSKKAETE